MDKDVIQKVKDAIAKSNNIGIAVGENPSIDEMGSALSFYMLLKNANKKVSIACPTDPIVEISSLVGIDKVQKQFGGDAGDLVVSFPYEEGDIEKVSYTLENNFLNIIVKASEQGLSFDEKAIRYTRGSGTIDLLITVGVSKLSELGNLFDEQKYSHVKIINIDNDETNQGYGDIVLVSPDSSSVSEHLADIVLTLGFSMDQDVSQNLMSGVMSATKNFQDPKTTSLAFEVASFLMRSGAQRINQPNAQSFEAQMRPMSPKFSEPQVQNQPQQEQAQPVAQVVEPVQSAPQTQQAEVIDAQEQNQDQDEPPLDWLTPKVYKGSSEV